jgi:2-polyprenyl-3-methyl-5-hydroxy-6-metoxy-1,4-benzoquinol methylase
MEKITKKYRCKDELIRCFMIDTFLSHNDRLSQSINKQALALYNQIKALRLEELGLVQYCLNYFKSSHYTRLFFSIETSANLLYRSILLKKKEVDDIVLMDYGAGMGTLYMLAKMIGCKKVVYNDFNSDWKYSAEKLADALLIKLDEYITGDIDQTVQALREKNIACDIIISRNVIEHIYKLDTFYQTLYTNQPQALIYSSTTANYYNPGTHLQHVLWHKKWEKVYYQQRIEIIKKKSTGINGSELKLLATATRGLASGDLETAITNFNTTKILPDVQRHYTNTCNPANGVWVEHLLTFEQYRNQIGLKNYNVTFLVGFWDTHYSKSWKNIFSKFLNALIRLFGKAGFLIAPFIYVVAEPKPRK